MVFSLTRRAFFDKQSLKASQLMTLNQETIRLRRQYYEDNLMKVLIGLVAAGLLLLAPAKSYSYYVAMPANNLIQNPYFASLFSDWSGTWAGIGNVWASAPNDNLCMAEDVYQDIPTAPGQMYSVSFYAAADIYFGQTVTVDLDINSQLLTSYTTPPNLTNPGSNRIDSMEWQNYTASFEAASSTTQVEFADANTYDFGLTSISVVPVPEPAATSLLAGGIIGGMVIRFRRRNSS
jgi:Protein of unknown function (DUF642)